MDEKLVSIVMFIDWFYSESLAVDCTHKSIRICRALLIATTITNRKNKNNNNGHHASTSRDIDQKATDKRKEEKKTRRPTLTFKRWSIELSGLFDKVDCYVCKISWVFDYIPRITTHSSISKYIDDGNWYFQLEILLAHRKGHQLRCTPKCV